MQNYRMLLAYDGGRYHGWQGQGNTDGTIQAKLETVLERLTGERAALHASGRTDAGVHAAGQVVSFTLERPVSCRELQEAFQRYLPEDIGVLRIEYAPSRFHARYAARAKTYVYRIWNSPLPDVFGRKYRLTVSAPLDLPAMESAARLLEGRHDFRSFCGLPRYRKSTVRTVYEISIRKCGSEVSLRFRGDGFLNRMVRILSGTLVEVGLGIRQADSMTELLEARSRSAAAGALPPHGLMLERVEYGEETVCPE